MATETLHFEEQAVATAERELEEAKKAFEDQLNVYRATADSLYYQTNEFRNKRSFWLEKN